MAMILTQGNPMYNFFEEIRWKFCIFFTDTVW